MLLFLLLPALLAPDPALGKKAFTPPKLSAPAHARYNAQARTETGEWGTELWARAAIDVFVEPTRSGGASWSREEAMSRVLAQTDFGLVSAEQLLTLSKAPSRLRWEVAKDGSVVFDGGPAGAGMGELGTAPAALMGMVSPPGREVLPGDTWPRTASLHQDTVIQGKPVRLDLVVHSQDRFEGWVSRGGRALPLFTSEGTVELTLLIDGRYPGGGVVRVHAQSLVDPDDGLPVWTAAETRLVLANGGSDRSTVVQGWTVSTREPSIP